MPRRPQPGSRGFDASGPGGNPRDLDGDPLAGEDDPDLDADRAITRLLARWFPAPVDPRTSLEEPDIREPGPDSANVSNSPYTLPRGWVYLENEPRWCTRRAFATCRRRRTTGSICSASG